MNTYILVAGGCIALNINVNDCNHLRQGFKKNKKILEFSTKKKKRFKKNAKMIRMV